MFHGSNGCPAAAAKASIFRLLNDRGVLHNRDDQAAVIAEWLESQSDVDEWTRYELRERGYGHLLQPDT
jgi:hypothetical protein